MKFSFANPSAALVTIVAAAFSSPAFAGELHGAAERSLNSASTTSAQMQSFETSIAVGGELGVPTSISGSGSSTSNGALAE